MIGLFFEDFYFSSDRAENRCRGYPSYPNFKFQVKTLIKIGFDTKNNTFAWFLCIFGQLTLDKLTTMATKNGLTMFCKIQNFADTHSGKVTEFQGNSLSRFGVVRHFLAAG